MQITYKALVRLEYRIWVLDPYLKKDIGSLSGAEKSNKDDFGV